MIYKLLERRHTETVKIIDYIKNHKKLANEKAKIKRKKAIKSTNEANKLINKTNVAVRKAKKDQLEANKAVNEAKRTTANNKIKLRRTTTSTKKIKPINQNINDIIKQLNT